MSRIDVVDITDRIAAAVRADFGSSADEVMGWIRGLQIDPEPGERIAAAVLARGQGDWRRARDAVKLAALDWRDVLMGTGLEHANWQQVLDERLGPTVSDDLKPGDLDKLARAASGSRFDLSTLPRIAPEVMPRADPEYRARVVTEVASAISAYDVHITAALLASYDVRAEKKGSALHQWAEERYPWMSLRTRRMLITRGLWHLK